MKRVASVTGVVVLGLAGLTACGGGGGYGSGSGSGSGSAPASTPAGGTAKLATATVGSLGKVVVDGNGRTVYVYDKDSKGKSNCEGGCLAKWPALAGGAGTPQLTGIDASLISTITRSDGSKQLALNGMPLYLYAQDTQAGQAKGQAVGGVWWAVGADGKKITTQSGGSGNGNGY
ncbi:MULTISPECIES: COG4315 family predicted lipoprotein [Kribbella]|uniref:Lipoprotein with Yx(FWY)xxD motif n=1 Tax=Kribbella karoonensis TaxID=324851 RepID=A0ABN2D3T5_9ACTN